MYSWNELNFYLVTFLRDYKFISLKLFYASQNYLWSEKLLFYFILIYDYTWIMIFCTLEVHTNILAIKMKNAIGSKKKIKLGLDTLIKIISNRKMLVVLSKN